MIESMDALHYLSIALTVMIPSIAVGIGEGIASIAAIQALNIQPSAKDEITNIAVIGMALIETAALLGMSMATILLFTPKASLSLYSSIAELGIAAAVCLPGFFIGLVSALPTKAACFAAARQPFFAQKILRFMLITQSLIQTPIVFGFIVAMFINNQLSTITTITQALKFVAAGLSIGLGSIGPCIGMALFAQSACQGIGINRNAYSKLLSFAIVSEAIIETPIIFSLVIAMLLLVMPVEVCYDPFVASAAFISAALCIGFGTLGAGIGSGRIAASACNQIVANPSLHGTLSRLSMFGQGLIDTCAIYALLIAIMIIIVL